VVDRIDDELLAWIKAQTDADVCLSPPGSRGDQDTVNVYLLRIERDPSPRDGRKKPPLQLVLHYLVTTSGPNLAQAHRLLWDLIVSAAARSETDGWEVDFRPLPDSTWAAFAVVPQPSLMLRIPVRHEWEQPKQPRVSQPPELEASPSTPLSGKVLGPGGMAISGARLELPSLGLTTATDAGGNFRFVSVPGGKNYPREIIVKAKGQTETIKLRRDAEGKPVHLQFDLVEV